MMCSKGLSLWALVPALLFLVANAVAVNMWVSRWWVTTIVLAVLLCQIMTLNYTCKFILELANVSNPDTYLKVSLCEIKSLHPKAVV